MKPQHLLSCLCAFFGAKIIVDSIPSILWVGVTSIQRFSNTSMPREVLDFFSMGFVVIPGFLGALLLWFAVPAGLYLARIAGIQPEVEWRMGLGAPQLLRAVLAALGAYFFAQGIPGILVAVIQMITVNRDPSIASMENYYVIGRNGMPSGGLGIVGALIQITCGYVLWRSNAAMTAMIFGRAALGDGAGKATTESS